MTVQPRDSKKSHLRLARLPPDVYNVYANNDMMCKTEKHHHLIEHRKDLLPMTFEISDITIRKYEPKDIARMVQIWNEVVEEGVAFPQEDCLDETSGAAFFDAQTYCGVAEHTATGDILGLYILHPNNVGRCGHICNASYAVSSASRGLHIGEKLVKDCIGQAGAHGFGILQFNAVVATNTHARHLYERLGFTQLGTIPKGFRKKDGHYEDICPYFIEV